MSTHDKTWPSSVKDLEKRFGSFIAVNRMSFEVPKGEIFGFLGPNGAGKSTTIRILRASWLPAAGAPQWRGSTSARKRKDQVAHRLHEPEVLALRGPDR